ANDPLNSKTFSAGLIREIGQGVTWLKENTERFIDSVLILHGAEDTLVSYKDSLEFFKEIPAQDKQVKLYGNFFHEIFNEYGKDEVMSDVVNWIKFRIKENSKRNNPVKRC
ncbi:MAG: alpha/beta hydrolase, partial [Clostridium sp.]|nr:alpha/beta hydrolase [Clostridium sp.]